VLARRRRRPPLRVDLLAQALLGLVGLSGGKPLSPKDD
jgi:hypothetical protein